MVTTRAAGWFGDAAWAQTSIDAGFDLVPLLAAISDWGERHLADGEQSDIDYRHASCGGKVSARLVCECGAELTPQGRLVAQINR